MENKVRIIFTDGEIELNADIYRWLTMVENKLNETRNEGR
jgi:hypothetical protein